MSKRPPFQFILDELAPMRPDITRAFGFTYVYLGDLLLCCLRASEKASNTNGMWLFTTTEHVDSLGSEFQDLPRRYFWRSKPNAWVVLPSRLEHFEEYAFKACELILNGDRRIGRASKRQPSRVSKTRMPTLFHASGG
jgi:hypothetical protein